MDTPPECFGHFDIRHRWFTGRGIVATNTNQALLGRLNFNLDIYRSLDILARHPRVDPQRLALMGFSRGGQAALYASLKRFNTLWNKSGVSFSAFIPFYPDCSTTYLGDTDVADVPIRIFHGTPDDYNPVASCRAFAKRLVEAKKDILITEYPDAAHGFDGAIGTGPVVAKGSQTVRACQIREAEGGPTECRDRQPVYLCGQLRANRSACGSQPGGA